jgi:DNA-binding Lrp family transcriptional regulator
MKELDPRDRELLTVLQSDLPLVSTPFAVIGQMIDMSEKEVLKRCERLRREGALRQIAGTFDPRNLGYRSCLVAAKIPEEQIDHAASVINLHPGVTQNYKRNHEYNLWFTIAIAPDSQLGLDGTLTRLGTEARWLGEHQFPNLRSFKSNDEPAETSENEPLTADEIQVVKLLQRDFPAQPRPFDALAKSSGLDPDLILEITRRLAARRQLRRISALIQSKRHTFSASAMGIWAVPERRVDEVGAIVAAHKAVTQCFLRPTYDDWPYNMFATVHGRSVDECETVIHEIADEADLVDRRVLFPVKEYKRARLNLFSGDAAAWEGRSEGGTAVPASTAG